MKSRDLWLFYSTILKEKKKNFIKMMRGLRSLEKESFFLIQF